MACSAPLTSEIRPSWRSKYLGRSPEYIKPEKIKRYYYCCLLLVVLSLSAVSAIYGIFQMLPLFFILLQLHCILAFAILSELGEYNKRTRSVKKYASHTQIRTGTLTELKQVRKEKREKNTVSDKEFDNYPINTGNETRTGTKIENGTGNGTRTGIENEIGNRTITGYGARTEKLKNEIRSINGVSGSYKTIRNFDEFNSPVSSMLLTPRATIPSNSNRNSLFERPSNLSTQFLNETQHNLILSSYVHIRTNNVIIPTISSPTFDNFSLPSYDQVLINQQNYEIEEETAPPTYDEIVLKINM